MTQNKTIELVDKPLTLADELANGPYQIVRAMAQGGMGDVYEVEHRELGRRLVMKVLRSLYAGNADAEARLKAEGRMLTKLRHPNLVDVIDFGRTPSGRPYLVTELLQGHNLREELRLRGPLDIAEAIDIAQQTLLGLEKVHEARLVHRDIKLDNLFYCEPDMTGVRRLKILDFGIARIALEDREAMGGVAPTADGMVLGTPAFMSPEQIMSINVDARTDLYAVGGVLFRLIAGKGPFEGPDSVSIMHAHLAAPIPVLSVVANRSMPRGLDELLTMSLQKNPTHRFQNAKSMASALWQISALDAKALASDRDRGRLDPNAAPLAEPSARDPLPEGIIDTDETLRDAPTNAADHVTIYESSSGRKR